MAMDTHKYGRFLKNFHVQLLSEMESWRDMHATDRLLSLCRRVKFLIKVNHASFRTRLRLLVR